MVAPLVPSTRTDRRDSLFSAPGPSTTLNTAITPAQIEVSWEQTFANLVCRG